MKDDWAIEEIARMGSIIEDTQSERAELVAEVGVWKKASKNDRSRIAKLEAERAELALRRDDTVMMERLRALTDERDMYYRNQRALQQSYLDALAERDKLEARVQEISEMCDIEYRHKVAFMARTTELEAERDKLRDDVRTGVTNVLKELWDSNRIRGGASWPGTKAIADMVVAALQEDKPL